MKAIEVKQFGDPAVMELVEKPAPEAGICEVVVQWVLMRQAIDSF